MGGNACSHLIGIKCLEDPSVKKVYHHGAHSSLVDTERFQSIPFWSPKDQILNTIKSIQPDLVVGTIFPIQFWDEFQNYLLDNKIPALVPSKEAGILEWSKVKGKSVLKELGIPTAEYTVYSREELTEKFKTIPRPFVFKYDQDFRGGLQTVIVTDDNVEEEYHHFLAEGTYRKFALMGRGEIKNFVVEQFIPSKREFSYHALLNETGWTYFGSARDYKKRYNDDKGYNTIGMGSYNIDEAIDPIIHSYVDKLFSYFQRNNIRYVGFLYLGILIGQDGVPYVLEINSRAGDPEVQSILLTIDGSLPEILFNAATQKVLPSIKFKSDRAVTLRVVNKDYINSTEDSKHPNFLTGNGDVILALNNDNNYTYGTLQTTAPTVVEAADKIYRFLSDKDLGDYTFRTDIGRLL